MTALADLDSRRFAQPALDTLFDAILVDDDVDPVTRLPDRIVLDHDPVLLLDGYRISRQLWIDGVDHAALVALIRRLERDGDLAPDDRVAFKHARAKLKHLRFACALFSARHDYPRVMDWTTTALGHLQDAFRTGRQARVRREAKLCRLLLSAGPRALLRREHGRFVPATTTGFRAFVAGEIDALDAALATATVTGARFHATRKIASRQVAFYSTMLAIAPTAEVHAMARSLAAINGLMGSFHDGLVERRAAGVQDYHREAFDLPMDIRERIAALVDRYRTSGLRGTERSSTATLRGL